MEEDKEGGGIWKEVEIANDNQFLLGWGGGGQKYSKIRL